MPEPGGIPRGTQPEGARNEQEASRQVREMFTRIAPRYDLLNHLLSAQMDRLWRARVARELKPILYRPDAVVLDLCCGTGDLAFSLARHANARIMGADFSHSMLVRANGKIAAHRTPVPAFFEADALRLPVADGSLDLVTAAFGLRNLANYEAGLREARRVLKPGGTLGILEFTEPAPGMLGNIYRWYTQKLLPKIGGLISGDQEAYAYLPQSVSRFFRPQELSALMVSVGFRAVRYQLMTFGSVALHIAIRP